MVNSGTRSYTQTAILSSHDITSSFFDQMDFLFVEVCHSSSFFPLKYNFLENDYAFHISEFSSLLECVSFPGRDGLKSNIVNDDGCKDIMK